MHTPIAHKKRTCRLMQVTELGEIVHVQEPVGVLQEPLDALPRHGHGDVLQSVRVCVTMRAPMRPWDGASMLKEKRVQQKQQHT